MTTPGFDVLSPSGGPRASGAGGGPIARSSASTIVPQAYPAQCQGAQGFAKTACYGVVLTCQDCCKQWNWQQSQYVDVCGASYICGACFGLPW